MVVTKFVTKIKTVFDTIPYYDSIPVPTPVAVVKFPGIALLIHQMFLMIITPKSCILSSLLILFYLRTFLSRLEKIQFMTTLNCFLWSPKPLR
jgi:hypothetical protein